MVFGIPYSLLADTLSARDFKLYRLFQRVYGPIGERRQDYRMASVIAHQCAKHGDTIEKFLLSFKYSEPEEDREPRTLEELLAKTVGIAAEITRNGQGEFREGPLLTLEFKPGELRRIQRNGNGSEPGD